jgi:hypothetical protein
MAKYRRRGKVRNITPVILNPDTVKFSFQFVDFDQSPNFALAKIVDHDFLGALFKELQHASRQIPDPYRQEEGNHSNDWDDLTEEGFNHVPDELLDKKPHQVRITSKARVRGIWEKNTFYIIWFDPDHLLRPYNIQSRNKRGKR